MSTDKGNRPAFPNHKDTSGWREGITIRDYFAAKAMQGYISNPTVTQTLADNLTDEHPLMYITEMAYEAADAMLKQREK
jgi:hypothetical protein